MWRTADALRERRTSWGRTPVLFYGFDDLSKGQRDVVETLADHAGAPVTVSLAYEPRRAFAGRVRTYEELRPLAGEVIELPATEAYYAPAAQRGPARARAPAVRGRARRRRCPPATPCASCPRRATAPARRPPRSRSSACASAGSPDEDVAIVLRSPGEDGPLFERVLGAAGIATARAREIPLGHTALGRGLLGLARAALAPEATLGDLLAWLRAPGVLDQPERADALEAECRRAAVTDVAEARRRWEEAGNFPLDELDRLRLRGQSPRSQGLLDGLGRAAEWLFVRPRRERAPVLDQDERLDALALGAVRRALAELAELGGGGGAEDVLAALGAVEVRDPEPVGSGAVLITDPLGIRARRFRAVIIAGLAAEAFPRPPRPEPFLSDDARRALAEAGIALRREEHGEAEEAYLFYAAASRATDALVLVARTADEEGNPLAALALRRRGRAAAGRRRAFRGAAWPTSSGRRTGRRPATPAPEDAPLTAVASRDVLALARHGTVLSAGAVEAYASCPARWLVEKELAPVELDPEPDAVRRGSIVHEALELTHARLRTETGTGRVTPANRARAEELMDTALAEARRALGADLPPVVAESIGREIAADLRRYLDQAERQSDTAFEPRDFELGFGMEEEGLGPLVLGEGDAAIGVRGRIDRVDVDPAGRAIVRDYKSGSGKPDMSAAELDPRAPAPGRSLHARRARPARARPRGRALPAVQGLERGRAPSARPARRRPGPLRRHRLPQGRRARPGRRRGDPRGRRGRGPRRGAAPALRRGRAAPGHVRLVGQRLPAPGHLPQRRAMTPAPTPEQAAAIARRDGDLLLAAGAGSGKTTVFAQRFVASVLDDGLAVGAILAITFTDKAAGQLVERISAAFAARGHEREAREAEAAWIDTIHGACARMLRAHPLAAGIDPRFGVLDEVAASRLESEAFERARSTRTRSALLAAYDRLPPQGRGARRPRRAARAGPARPACPTPARERRPSRPRRRSTPPPARSAPPIRARRSPRSLDACRERLDTPASTRSPTPTPSRRCA